MRARNREVNIFNMSLLDILTGMLGAFLFLMLGLVPYYMNAQNGGGGDDKKEPPVDTTFHTLARWNSPAKLDFFLILPSGDVHGADEKSMPLSKRAKINAAACPSSTGWQMVSCYANVGDRYLLAYSLQAPSDPESMRRVDFNMELMEVESDPKGNGLKSYYPDTYCTQVDASGAKPGVVYAVMWITVTKDSTKADYNHQYDFTIDNIKAGEKLPYGAVMMPNVAPASSVPFAPPPSPTPGDSTKPEPPTNNSSAKQPPPSKSNKTFFGFPR